ARAQGYVQCTPPKNIVSAVDAAMDLPGIRVITGIIGSPALRINGSILSTPGYDRQTGLFLDTDGEYPPLMSAPDAIECLDDVLYDFPFATPAHRSAAIASIVTLHARAAFRGPAPLFLLDANASRIGKGLFTDLVTMIYEGRPAGRYTPPNSDDEARKVI